MDRFKNIMLYADVGRKNYEDVKEKILETNRKSLIMFTTVAAIVVSIMSLLGNFIEILKSSQPAYIACVMISLLLYFMANGPAKKNKKLTYIGIYCFSGMLLCVGIALGTFIEPNQASASFGILLFAVPLLFTDIPLRMALMIIISIVVYMFAAIATQDASMLAFNESVVFPYGLLSIVVGTLMMKMKVNSHVLELKNKTLSELDQLTGMLNRRCYELKVDELKTRGFTKDLKICALDINGLKRVNDNLGHHAGDELIKGAADCIHRTFGSYGTCYRVGGDEFMVILEGPSPTIKELQASLQIYTSSFSGTLVTGLSISMGMVEAKGNESVSQLIIEADQKMYEAKNEYYIRNGIERRTK